MLPRGPGKRNPRDIRNGIFILFTIRNIRVLYALQVTSSGKVRRANDYKFFTEFQSHETEFDYLKSLEIEEKINAIKWCPRANGALFLLSTNGGSFAPCNDFCSSVIA